MADSRFFDGYVWCSMLPGCEHGICVKSDDAHMAAKKYADSYRRIHGESGLVNVYTMESKDDYPKLFAV